MTPIGTATNAAGTSSDGETEFLGETQFTSLGFVNEESKYAPVPFPAFLCLPWPSPRLLSVIDTATLPECFIVQSELLILVLPHFFNISLHRSFIVGISSLELLPLLLVAPPHLFSLGSFLIHFYFEFMFSPQVFAQSLGEPRVSLTCQLSYSQPHAEVRASPLEQGEEPEV